MIILKSDYSPEAASELQEKDNCAMLQALLILAGLSKEMLETYNHHTTQAAVLYGAEIDIEDASKLTDEHWAAAKKATVDDLEKADNILKISKITIKNKLIKPSTKDFFAHIETTVYRDGSPVAKIERPIIDIDAETYIDNEIGYNYE